jgi:hypothetical protein
MKHSPIRDNARTAAVVVIAMSHLAFFILDAFDRLVFTVNARSDVLQGVADHWLWHPLFLVVAVSILVCLRYRRGLRYALSGAFTVMGVWSLFTFLWGLYPIREVSLVGPVLGFAIAAISQALSLTYTEESDCHEKRE